MRVSDSESLPLVLLSSDVDSLRSNGDGGSGDIVLSVAATAAGAAGCCGTKAAAKTTASSALLSVLVTIAEASGAVSSGAMILAFPLIVRLIRWGAKSCFILDNTRSENLASLLLLVVDGLSASCNCTYK